MRFFHPHYCLGYLIRMLVQVIWDIRIFLFVLAIVYIGFGEAFLRISENLPAED